MSDKSHKDSKSKKNSEAGFLEFYKRNLGTIGSFAAAGLFLLVVVGLYVAIKSNVEQKDVATELSAEEVEFQTIAEEGRGAGVSAAELDEKIVKSQSVTTFISKAEEAKHLGEQARLYFEKADFEIAIKKNTEAQQLAEDSDDDQLLQMLIEQGVEFETVYEALKPWL